MASWKYKVTGIVDNKTEVDASFELYKDDKLFASDKMRVTFATFLNAKTTDRAAVVQFRIAERCKSYIAIDEAKSDLLDMVGREYALTAIVYPTDVEA